MSEVLKEYLDKYLNEMIKQKTDKELSIIQQSQLELQKAQEHQLEEEQN